MLRVEQAQERILSGISVLEMEDVSLELLDVLSPDEADADDDGAAA